jgi:hypothetical protein
VSHEVVFEIVHAKRGEGGGLRSLGHLCHEVVLEIVHHVP